MDLANSTLDDDETAAAIYHRKHLSLEARHSKAIESSRKIRSTLPASIFIPKQRVKSQNSPRSPLTTSPKILSQPCASNNAKPNINLKTPHDADNPSLRDPRPDIKRKLEFKQTDQMSPKHSKRSKHKKHKRHRKKLLEGPNVIRTTLWMPPPNSKHNEVLSDRSIEDELRSMGLEVSSDTEYFETSLAKRQGVSSDDIVKSLNLNETETHAEKQTKEADILKSTAISKTVQGKMREKSSTKPSKKQSRVKKKKNHSEFPTQELGITKFAKDNQKFQEYNDSLHAVKDFQDILRTIFKNSSSNTDHEINQNLMELQNSINKFSAFLFKTYRNLELMTVLPSRLNQNLDTTQPTNVPQLVSKFVVRIDVPNIMEQVITFNTDEILQHSIENNENVERVRQKREPTKILTLEKSAKRNTEIHSDSIELPNCRSQSPGQRKTQIQEPPIPHHAFTNQSVQDEQRSNQAEECTEATSLYQPCINQYAVSDHHIAQTQETRKEPILNPAYTKNSALAGQRHPFTEPTILPAFRNPTVLANSKLSPAQNCIMPQQDQIQANNYSIPSGINSNSNKSTVQGATNNCQYPQNTKNPQTSASAEQFSPYSENFLRPTVVHQSLPFNIPYPVAQQITPSDSGELFAARHSSTTSPLLTPPQTTDCQSSPVYRTLPYYLYPGYNQNAIVPMTPPSEDIRYEGTHQHQPPPIFAPTLGVCSQDRWPYIYKDMGASPYLSYLNNAVTAPGPYPQAYGEF